MIFIGKILRVRGNKGEVVITSPAVGLHAFAGREGGKESGKKDVILKSEKHEKKSTIEFLKEINRNPVLKLKGIDSINDAFKVVGYSVYLESGSEVTEGKEYAVPGENEDIPPLEGYSIKDVHGDLWGEVVYFDTAASNKLLEIQGKDEDDVYYVPFTKTIIKKIDKKERLIIIDPPEGLKNLNKK